LSTRFDAYYYKGCPRSRAPYNNLDVWTMHFDWVAGLLRIDACVNAEGEQFEHLL